MIRAPISRVREGLSGWVVGVARGGGVVILTRKGRDLAAIVPLSMIELAERVERHLPEVSAAAESLRDISVGATALTEAKLRR